MESKHFSIVWLSLAFQSTSKILLNIMENKLTFFCQETMYVLYNKIYEYKGKPEIVFNFGQLMRKLCVHKQFSIIMYNKFTTPILQSRENYLISLFKC